MQFSVNSVTSVVILLVGGADIGVYVGDSVAHTQKPMYALPAEASELEVLLFHAIAAIIGPRNGS